LDEETNPVDNINYNKANIIADDDENVAEIYNPADTENYDDVSADDLSLDSDHLEDIEKLNKEPSKEFVKAESKNIDSDKPKDLESKEDKAVIDTEDYNIDEIVKNPEEEDFKNPEDEDFEYYPKDDLKDAEKPLKDRLGFDVSYEDLAKAVRTEMKKDKE